MAEPITIVKGKHGGANLCERCAVGTRIDDSQEEFYECSSDISVMPGPTLRHRREYDEYVRLSPGFQWDDETPEYPILNASVTAGCELCAFVQKALRRRNIEQRGKVAISCFYRWHNAIKKPVNSGRDMGLLSMRCKVFSMNERIAYINFPIDATDDVGSWLRSDEHIYQDPLDPGNVDWIKDELVYCDNECEHPPPPTQFLPTRLIDIGKTENSRPRLVTTTSLIDEESPGLVKYAALSYCWGPREDAEQQVKTTWSNLHSFCQEIPEEQLTPVIKDTFRVCRTLQIRYVWIDALCIIQGCMEDWPRESEVMGLVYYHSYLTICPLSSHSCLESFLLPRQGVNIDFESSIRKEKRGFFTLRYDSNDVEYPSLSSSSWLDKDRTRSTWDTRGWTLQENSFSPRLLFFGQSMVHFVCENSESSENGHLSFGPGVISGLRELKDIELSSNRSMGSKHRACGIWSQFFSLIHTRVFTYKPDFFPSIAGLAKACGEILEDTYVAGLWTRYLYFGLLWVLKGPPPGSLDAKLEALRHPDPYIAPSWSWVSPKEYFESFVPWWGPNGRPSHLQSQITLVDYHIDLESQTNPHGRIKSAALLLRGRMVALPSDVKMRPDGEKYAMGHLAGKRGTVMFDWVVTENTVQERGRLKMLLTTSCCQGTSNLTSEFFADPDEDHTTTFSKTQPEADQFDDEYDENDDDDINATSTCFSCLDEASPPNCFGLMLHPAESPGAYVRVGVFQLFGGSGGSQLFEHEAEREVKIV